MISQREKSIYFSFCAAQIFSATLLFAIFYLINDNLRTAWISAPNSYFQLLLVMILTMLGEASLRVSSQRVNVGRAPRRLALSLARRQSLWLAAGFGVALALTRDTSISRSFLIGFAALSYPFFYLTNRYGRRCLSKLIGDPSHQFKLRTLVVGPPSWAQSILDNLSTLHDFDVQPLLAFTSKEDLEPLLNKIGAIAPDLLIIPSHDLPYESITRLLAFSDRKGIRCWIPVEISRRCGRIFDLQNISRISFLSPPTLPLASTGNRFIKRAFDISVSLLIIPFVLAPLVAFVAVIQRFSSPGPVFYRQERVGEDGRIFQIVKFRTMHVQNDDEARQAARADTRIYRAGQWLRRLSLDEFPQFINVLRGEMSVVGPRPHMIEHERKFESFYELYGSRRYVKPGVTGLAQVEGFRGEIVSTSDVRGRARYDLFYVRHWSFGLDLRIILQTLGVLVFPPKQAY